MKKSKWGNVVGFLLLAISISFTFPSCNSQDKKNLTDPCVVLYDICTEDYKVHRGELESGQTLGAELYLNHIDHGRIDQIVRASKEFLISGKPKRVKSLQFCVPMTVLRKPNILYMKCLALTMSFLI